MSTNRYRSRTTQTNLERSMSAVTRKLKANREALNAADALNNNHGDNMVKNFQVITRAVREKRDAPPSEQLAYASQVLSQKATSGSGAAYAQGLARAARQLEGQPEVTKDNALQFIEALMGAPTGASQSSGAAASVQADPLAGLLGALASGQGQQAQSSAQGDDMLGMLGGLLGSMGQQSSGASSPNQGGDLVGMLGGLLGGQATGQPGSYSSGQGAAQGGIDVQTLMTAGMAYMQAKQSGATNMQAIAQAVTAASQMGQTTHHSQSGQLVAGTLLSTIGSILGGGRR